MERNIEFWAIKHKKDNSFFEVDNYEGIYRIIVFFKKENAIAMAKNIPIDEVEVVPFNIIIYKTPEEVEQEKQELQMTKNRIKYLNHLSKLEEIRQNKAIDYFHLSEVLEVNKMELACMKCGSTDNLQVGPKENEDDQVIGLLYVCIKCIEEMTGKPFPI